MGRFTSLQKGKRLAIEIIIIFGIVSLFGDIMYEGARAVNGPYLKTLGANAALVGFIAGLGEFLGYIVRLASGYFADKTKAYWAFTLVGYGFLVSVPLLSLTGVWQVAALFMVLERFGKALRAPAKDTILSTATKQVGTGFGFGLHGRRVGDHRILRRVLRHAVRVVHDLRVRGDRRALGRAHRGLCLWQ